MKILHQYQNGNTKVTLYDDGTKIREWPDGEESIVDLPESVDLKITNWCNMSSICKYCHEQSNLNGKHADLDFMADIWDTSLVGSEIALGGGSTLHHPDIEKFLRRVTTHGCVPNVTINSLHIKSQAEQIRQYQDEKMVYGIGISYRGKNSLSQLPEIINYQNVVFHTILGLNDFEDCKAIIDWCRIRNIKPKILFLGYKQYGNGSSFFTENPWLEGKLNEWKNGTLQKVLKLGGTFSFDNLAITQLDLQKTMPKKKWDLFYQGTDGTHTQYIDAVEKKAARTSTTANKYDIVKGDTLKEIFAKVRV